VARGELQRRGPEAEEGVKPSGRLGPFVSESAVLDGELDEWLCHPVLPPPLERNQADLEVLYRALGRGLVQWQWIEPGLYLAAFGASGMTHEECSKKYFKLPGAGARLTSVNQLLKASLPPIAYDTTWLPLCEHIGLVIKYRNALAHFEVFHITDADRIVAEPPTAYNVLISESHMNAGERDQARVKALSIEVIEQNNAGMREVAYQLMYFVVDHFPVEVFLGKGLLPLTERQLLGFHQDPRPPECRRPNYLDP
jgi:hypothetical protein